MDEYYYPKNRTLKEMYKELEKECDAVQIDPMQFGSNGHITRPNASVPEVMLTVIPLFLDPLH